MYRSLYMISAMFLQFDSSLASLVHDARILSDEARVMLEERRNTITAQEIDRNLEFRFVAFVHRGWYDQRHLSRNSKNSSMRSPVLSSAVAPRRTDSTRSRPNLY